MFERKLTSVSPWGTLSIVLVLTGCLGLDQTVETDETELPETQHKQIITYWYVSLNQLYNNPFK